MYGMLTWFVPNRFAKTWPGVQTFFTALRRHEAARLPVGVAGYCWGGHHAVQLAAGATKADGKPLIDAAFTAHPSFLKYYADIEQIRIPTSVAAAERDDMMSPAQAAETRRILEDELSSGPANRKGELRVYKGFSHGFACRIDPKNADPAGPEQAENQALAWFEKHFEGAAY